MSLLGLSDMTQIERMTTGEYALRMKAYRRRRLEEERVLHKLAFLNVAAQSTKKTGKHVEPVYKTLKDFFDYEEELKELYTGKKDKSPSSLGDRVMQAMRKQEKNG